MLSEEYFGFVKQVGSRVIGRRTELSAEKLSHSKSREKSLKKLNDTALENLRKKYNEISKDKNRVKSKRNSYEHYDHPKNRIFRYFHYNDEIPNGADIEYKHQNRVSDTALRKVSVDSASGYLSSDGCVNDKLSGKVKKIIENKRILRSNLLESENKGQNSARSSSKQTLSLKNSHSEAGLKSLAKSNRVYSKIIRRSFKDENKLDEYNMRGIKENKSKPSLQGRNSLKREEPIRSNEIEKRLMSKYAKYADNNNQELELKKSSELEEMLVDSKHSENSSLPLQSSDEEIGRIGYLQQTNHQSIVPSDYDIIKEMEKRAKEEHFEMNKDRNEEIEFNKVQTFEYDVRNNSNPRTNTFKSNASGSNILSKVIRNSDEIFGKYKETPNWELLNKEMNDTPAADQKKRMESLQSQESLQFNHQSLQKDNNSQNQYQTSPSFLGVASGHSERAEKGTGMKSSMKISESNPRYSNSERSIDMEMLNSSMINSKKGEKSPKSSLSDQHAIKSPPLIFESHEEKNFLFNSFNLAEAIREFGESEDRKMFGLFSKLNSSFESEGANNVMSKIKVHLECITKIADFVEETETFYIDERQKELFHHPYSYLLLKKYYYEREFMINCLITGDHRCFRLSHREISKEELLNSKIVSSNSCKTLINDIKEGNSRLRTLINYLGELIHKDHFEAGLENELTDLELKEITGKLKEELDLLMHKINENADDMYEEIEKDIEYDVISQRCFSIMELVFLLSELKGRKVKQIEMLINPEDFQEYFRLCESLFLETILYLS